MSRLDWMGGSQSADWTFHAAGLDYHSDYILPHGSYLINLGNPDKDKRDTSYKCFIDDLKRCEQLGIKLYNWQ